MKSKVINFIILLLIAALAFVLDYVTKISVLKFIQEQNFTGYEVNQFFNIIIAYNRGISFGMLNDPIYNQWMFVVLNSAIVFCLVVWAVFCNDRKAVFMLSIIVGGAIGNIYDRFAYGAVVDFLDFHIGGWHYPAFNIADSFVVIGVLGLFILTLKTPSVSNKQTPKN